jgi:flagellar biosynthetic protein FliQ
MTPEDVIYIATISIEAMVRASLPMMMTSLVVGLVITIIQALTQIQDPMLQFTPKILLTMAAILLSMSYTASQFTKLTAELFGKIVLIGSN